MGIPTLMLLMFILILVLIILLVILILRIKNIEKRLVNFTPTEAYTIMENLRDMVLESERIADGLENSIKQKEEMLEDLSDLIDEKLARLTVVLDTNVKEKDIKTSIISLHSRGLTDTDIARELGISVTEVRIAISMSARK